MWIDGRAQGTVGRTECGDDAHPAPGSATYQYRVGNVGRCREREIGTGEACFTSRSTSGHTHDTLHSRPLIIAWWPTGRSGHEPCPGWTQGFSKIRGYSNARDRQPVAGGIHGSVLRIPLSRTTPARRNSWSGQAGNAYDHGAGPTPGRGRRPASRRQRMAHPQH